MQVQGERVAGGDHWVKSREEEEEVVNVVEEEESVETLETQACCYCWPRSAAPEKRAQDVRGTICFWGSTFRGFHVKAEFEPALGELWCQGHSWISFVSRF